MFNSKIFKKFNSFLTNYLTYLCVTITIDIGKLCSQDNELSLRKFLKFCKDNMNIFNKDISNLLVKNLVLIATASTTTPWAAAFNESQRMAIEADQTYGNESADAGIKGMGVARSIALLSYRGADAYNATQQNRGDETTPFGHRVLSYQRHQGEKLENRFNAYSYYRLTQVVDSHNVGRNRGSIAEALRTIKARTQVVAISSDILFPPADHDVFIENIPDVRYTLINSEFGHDGFLVEHEYLTQIIKDFLI